MRLHNSKWIWAKRSFVNCRDWFTGISHLSYATACLHPCVSFNNEKNCHEISEHKIAVCEKTACLRSGNSSDMDSASLKMLVSLHIDYYHLVVLKTLLH